VSSTRVLVAGASIAGPALGHWLRRRGAEVTVMERAPGLRPGGQAVDARGVAKEVIRRMGLDAAVRAACTETVGARMVDAEGNVLQAFRADDEGGDSVPNEFGLDRWMIEYQEPGSGRSALLRPVQDAARGMAMFSFPSAVFDVDYRDVAA
jgi:2-polyprenyl-6-methoxyphenol hydroxylase-like FAD-dependent oxidoreductase